MAGRLTRRLGLIEAIGLSLSVIAPTMAMAFNVTLAAQAAGPAAPLAFAVGTIVVGTVGLSFVAFARRLAHAGSAYAYLQAAVGPRAGFLTGWLLLLTYLSFTTATASLAGNFLQAAGGALGIAQGGWFWLVASVASTLIAILFAYRNMEIAARAMLVLEVISVVAILVLSALILRGVLANGGLSLIPFEPSAGFGGWSGVGFAMVYAVLCFAGFEGATTLGEEMRAPYRDIPRAVFGTVVVAGLFYVLVSYAQVVGFGPGPDGVKALSDSQAPLNDLALRYASPGMAVAIDLAAALSAFSCTLGSLSAAARLLFALGRGGHWGGLGDVHPRYGTPGRAVLVSGGVAMAGLLLWAPLTGAADYYGYTGTIGALALILVYLAVGVAHAMPAVGLSLRWVGGVAVLLLLWPLGNSLVPVPPYPFNLLPYVVLAWGAAGWVWTLVRPVRADASIDINP